ncbi:hypothetical protein J2Z66_004812 [Paenibacillus eucommiae]|uniref:Uncharacterized protein n=1 Tax=Paenibacillus eucommiae TaxID=1355755 RepID=A0ABS4J067_9BACL|nr:hypothetical protein [Paenibacillus eucommiae]
MVLNLVYLVYRFPHDNPSFLVDLVGTLITPKTEVSCGNFYILETISDPKNGGFIGCETLAG